MWGRLGPVAGRLGTPLLETKPATGAVPKQSEAMTRRTPSKKHPVARATLWFCLVMAPSWCVLLFGCEFEPSAIGHHPPVADSVADSDNDGGE